MVKIEQETIELAIDGLEEKIWFQESSLFPDIDYIKKAKTAINNLIDYASAQKLEKEEKFSMRTNE